MSDIALRPYQQKFIDDIRLQFRLGHRHVVGVAPCGAGKTIMTGWMIRQSLARGKRSIFFVHRQELIRQTSDTFTRLDIPHGIIAAGVPMHLHLPVQIASVQTLARRLDKISAPDFLICDECHHILANTYKKVLDAFPKAFLLGVTATPERMGGITLCDSFDSMVLSLSVNQLIELGNLVPFRYFAPDSHIDLSDVRADFGDYNQSDLSKAMRKATIIGDIVENYRRIAPDKAAICYAVDVNHSISIADAFNAAGIPAAHCDGNTSTSKRDRIVDDFRRGNIQVLCNAELFGEGFDVPHCQAVILARPTLSLPLFIQQSMRPLRPDPDDPNKVAIIIDHVQNYKQHGYPNDLHHWSLDPNVKDDLRQDVSFVCPTCQHINKRKMPLTIQHDFAIPIPCSHCKTILFLCPHCLNLLADNYIPLDDFYFRHSCGGKFRFINGSIEEGEYHPRRKDNIDGSLFECDVSFFDNKKEASASSIILKPTTPEQFLQIANERGYKIGWVANKSIPFANSYDDFVHIADVCGYHHGWVKHAWQDFLDEKIFAEKLQSARMSC